MTRLGPESGGAGDLRQLAVGALSGLLAGFLFGVITILVQAAITQVTIASYGKSAVYTIYAFDANPQQVVVSGLLGSVLGLLYGAAHSRLPTPGVATAFGFAVMLVLVLQPLFLGAHITFSALIFIIRPGFIKPFPKEVAPPLLLGSILAALILLEGLAIALFARLGGQRLPRLPAAAYVIIAAGLALPGFGFFLFLLLAATGSLYG